MLLATYYLLWGRGTGHSGPWGRDYRLASLSCLHSAQEEDWKWAQPQFYMISAGWTLPEPLAGLLGAFQLQRKPINMLPDRWVPRRVLRWDALGFPRMPREIWRHLMAGNNTGRLSLCLHLLVVFNFILTGPWVWRVLACWTCFLRACCLLNCICRQLQTPPTPKAQGIFWKRGQKERS